MSNTGGIVVDDIILTLKESESCTNIMDKFLKLKSINTLPKNAIGTLVKTLNDESVQPELIRLALNRL